MSITQANVDLESLAKKPLYKHVKREDLVFVLDELTIAEDRINDNCVDNYRVFPENMQDEFNKVADSGCCGSYNDTIIGPSGTKYLIGFNYGH